MNLSSPVSCVRRLSDEASDDTAACGRRTPSGHLFTIKAPVSQRCENAAADGRWLVVNKLRSYSLAAQNHKVLV